MYAQSDNFRIPNLLYKNMLGGMNGYGCHCANGGSLVGGAYQGATHWRYRPKIPYSGFSEYASDAAIKSTNKNPWLAYLGLYAAANTNKNLTYKQLLQEAKPHYEKLTEADKKKLLAKYPRFVSPKYDFKDADFDEIRRLRKEKRKRKKPTGHSVSLSLNNKNPWLTYLTLYTEANANKGYTYKELKTRAKTSYDTLPPDAVRGLITPYPKLKGKPKKLLSKKEMISKKKKRATAKGKEKEEEEEDSD